MGDYGRRDKKNDKGSDHTIEEQIILRVPPAIAEGVRTLLKGKQTNADSDLSFEMHTERKGEMTFEGKKYPVTLVDLPCVIESNKTLDRRTFYKSADVHQMLLVEDPNGMSSEEGDRFKPSFDAEWRLDTGLTRLTRHIRTKRWRRHPSFPRAEVERIAEELSKMKRGAPIPDRYEYVEITEVTHAAPPKPAPTLLVAKPTSSVTVKATTASQASNKSSSSPSPSLSAPNAAQTPATTLSISTAPKLTVSLPQSQASGNTPSSMNTSSLLTPSTPATPATPTPVTATVGGGKFKFKFGAGAKKTTTTGEEANANNAPTAAAGASTGPKLVFASSAQSVASNSSPVVSTNPQTFVAPQSTAIAAPIANPNAMAVDIAPAPTPPPPSVEPTSASATLAPGTNSAEYDAKLAQRAGLARQKVSEEAQLAKQLANAQNEKNAMMKKRIQQTATDTQARIKKLEEQIAVLDQALQAFGV
jgi:transcription initiation factor TFIID subunit 7